MQMYGTVLWFVRHLLFFVCALFMLVLQLQHLSIYNINSKWAMKKPLCLGHIKDEILPSYGDYFVHHHADPFFQNQDLRLNRLRQSGVSGNVSSKDFLEGIWHSCWPKILQVVVDMLKTNACPLKIDGWKMFHFLLSKNCPFSGSTFIGFRGLFKEVFFKYRSKAQTSKDFEKYFQWSIWALTLWHYDFLQTWIHQSKITVTALGKQVREQKNVLVAVELKLQFS